jgi:anti-sigma-K factor RskA
VNLKEYISSGILEAYLLDEVTPQERLEVQRMVNAHPELKLELSRIEVAIEALAQKAALAPRKEVKEKMLQEIIKTSDRKPDDNVIQIKRQHYFWRYAAAASVAIALGASYLAYEYRQRWQEVNIVLSDLRGQNQRVAEDYNVVNQRLEKIKSDFSVIESTAFHKVVMKGTPTEPTALASVYWNASTEEVFLSIQNLKDISKDNQFQLWAIVNGKPVDAGVFDAGYSGLLKMKSVKGASAFAVTIEPRGGKESPTLTTMQVIGTLG